MNFRLTILFLFISFFPQALFCQVYSYYFGNIHAHSSYSDGNKDSSTSFMTKPLQDFMYAKNSFHTDFYGISEHNHLSAGMNNPAHYHMGISDANTANQDYTFVALYGMEWGVISGGGHVIIYGYDSLIGWDPNDYDVYVAQNDYSNLWKKVNAKNGAFAYLAHPQTTDYNNLFSSVISSGADSAIIGMAARSGSAFSIDTTYSNPSTSNFIARYNDALKLGYHVGVGLDHDSHYSVFCRQSAGRMVVLAPSLTRANILNAIKNMRFYSSDDWNTSVDFNIQSQPMGSIYSHALSPGLSAIISDSDGEQCSKIEVYSGVPGSSLTATIIYSVSNSNILNYTHVMLNNTSNYYYLKITQVDGDIIWTSPIWYTRNDLITTQLNTTNAAQNSFILYPNPVNNEVFINLSAFGGAKEIYLLDGQGKLLYQRNTSDAVVQIDLVGFSKGMYTLKVSHSGQTHIRKFVKE